MHFCGKRSEICDHLYRHLASPEQLRAVAKYIIDFFLDHAFDHLQHMFTRFYGKFLQKATILNLFSLI